MIKMHCMVQGCEVTVEVEDANERRRLQAAHEDETHHWRGWMGHEAGRPDHRTPPVTEEGLRHYRAWFEV